MPKPLVGCAGIVVADMFCGPMDRLPDPGQLLSVSDMPTSTGGCAANVAIGLSRQKIASKLFAAVGNDASGHGLVSDLQTNGIDCASVRRHERLPTSKTAILLVKGEDRRYIHSFGANADFSTQDIPLAELDGLKVFYLGGLCVLPAMQMQLLAKLLAHCRQNGIVTVVDVVVPQGKNGMDDIAPLLTQIDYFLPNEDEAARLTGYNDPVEQSKAFTMAGVNTVIITRASAGAFARRGNEFWTIPAHQIDAVDPSGSGDAFCSGIIAGIVHGWEMPRMLQYASALGASATLLIGTTAGVFTTEEAEAFMKCNPLAVKTGRINREQPQ